MDDWQNPKDAFGVSFSHFYSTAEVGSKCYYYQLFSIHFAFDEQFFIIYSLLYYSPVRNCKWTKFHLYKSWT